MKQSIAKELLKDRESIFLTIRHGELKDVLALLIQFILISLIGIYLYGFVMGAFHPSLEFRLSLGMKLLLTIIGSAIICLPSLYVLTSLSGSDKSLKEVFILLFGKIAVVGLILIGFLPIIWFFTLSIEHPTVLLIINLILIGIAFIFAIFFLGKAVSFFTKAKRKRNKLTVFASLFCWLIILFSVILQMAGNVKPFFRFSEGYAKITLDQPLSYQEISSLSASYKLDKVCGKDDEGCFYDSTVANERNYFFVRIPHHKNEIKWQEALLKKENILGVEFVKKEKIDKREL